MIRKKMIVKKTLHSCVTKINFYDLVNQLEEMKYLNKREGHFIRTDMPEFIKSASVHIPSERNAFQLALLAFLLGKSRFDDTM